MRQKEKLSAQSRFPAVVYNNDPSHPTEQQQQIDRITCKIELTAIQSLQRNHRHSTAVSKDEKTTS